MKKSVVRCVVAWREDKPDTRNDDELPMWLRICDHVGDFCGFRPIMVRLGRVQRFHNG